ncbi:MAG: RhoGAP domain-containing protein [Janthinobacterium lividum]
MRLCVRSFWYLSQNTRLQEKQTNFTPCNQHLNRVQEHSQTNRMSTSNLAICFA